MSQGTEQSPGSMSFPSNWVQRHRLLASLPASCCFCLCSLLGWFPPREGRKERAGGMATAGEGSQLPG